MPSIVIASAKGGVGKTTLAQNLGAAAAGRNLSVTLIDTDPQFNLSSWWDSRRFHSGLPLLDLRQASLVELAKNGLGFETDLVLVDTPPVMDETGALTTLVEAADYVLIPCKPSPLDVESTRVTQEIAETTGTLFGYVLTQAIARASMTEIVKRTLVERQGTVCPFVVHTRQDFTLVANQGVGVTEVKQMKKSAEEIQAVLSFLLQQVGFFHGGHLADEKGAVERPAR